MPPAPSEPTTSYEPMRVPGDRAIPSGGFYTLVPPSFLRPGRDILAAGYVIYGPQTVLVASFGNGVRKYLLDRASGSFRLAGPLNVPARSSEFAINASNYRHWDRPIRAYIDDCLAGATGPQDRDFNMRWIASLVAETHRILMRGGVFMYPRDRKDLSKAGRLRLLYEANPIGMIMEQAGGSAVTATAARILDVQPTSIHQRTSVVLGSADEVSAVVRHL